MTTTVDHLDDGPPADAKSADDADGSASTETAPPAEACTLDLDQVFEILKNQRRRYVLQYLFATEDVVTLSDLAEHIAALENDKTVREISSSERKRVYVGLYQCHLPKMDGMDIVDFNKNRTRIAPAPNIDRFEPYLEPQGETGVDWRRYHGGVAAANAGLLSLALVGSTLTAMPLVHWASLLAVLTFVAVALAHFIIPGERDGDGRREDADPPTPAPA